MYETSTSTTAILFPSQYHQGTSPASLLRPFWFLVQTARGSLTEPILLNAGVGAVDRPGFELAHSVELAGALGNRVLDAAVEETEGPVAAVDIEVLAAGGASAVHDLGEERARVRGAVAPASNALSAIGLWG
ncbi:hypothetical protein PG991_007187 [Apiospora marii]|uniref:Uncharacterized protein n=1 Tax=Apiospora marii TaxID=335849 RepID=A0ABR1RSY5_9PEZI